MNAIKERLSKIFRNLILMIKGSPRGALQAAQSRQARFGGISAVSIVVVVSILVLINLMVKTAGVRFDTTKNKLYSLSPETIKILKDLKQDTKALVFITNDPQTAAQKDEIKKLLDEYKLRSSKFSYEYIDPYAKQSLALSYGIGKEGAVRQGTIVFVQGDKIEQTVSSTEADVSAALLKLSNPNKVKVVFWTGTGEKDPEITTEEGYSEVKSSLEKLNYTVVKHDAARDPVIASDTGVLVLAGPRTPYLSRQIEAISKYLENGGRMLVMFETLQNFQNTGLEDLLGKYGISIKQGVALDPTEYFDNPGFPAVGTYPTHQITESIGGTVYINPILAKPTDKVPDGMTVQSIVETTDKSWFETSIDQNPKYDAQKGDIKGPISIATAMKYAKPEKDPKKLTRVVAIGDSDSGSNFVVQYRQEKKIVVSGNLDLIINSVNWLASREDLISIVPKDRTPPTMSINDQQLRGLQYLVMGIMPVTFVLLAIFVWWRRKKLRV